MNSPAPSVLYTVIFWNPASPRAFMFRFSVIRSDVCFSIPSESITNVLVVCFSAFPYLSKSSISVTVTVLLTLFAPVSSFAAYFTTSLLVAFPRLAASALS